MAYSYGVFSPSPVCWRLEIKRNWGMCFPSSLNWIIHGLFPHYIFSTDMCASHQAVLWQIQRSFPWKSKYQHCVPVSICQGWGEEEDFTFQCSYFSRDIQLVLSCLSFIFSLSLSLIVNPMPLLSWRRYKSTRIGSHTNHSGKESTLVSSKCQVRTAGWTGVEPCFYLLLWGFSCSCKLWCSGCVLRSQSSSPEVPEFKPNSGNFSIWFSICLQEAPWDFPLPAPPPPPCLFHF